MGTNALESYNLVESKGALPNIDAPRPDNISCLSAIHNNYPLSPDNCHYRRNHCRSRQMLNVLFHGLPSK